MASEARLSKKASGCQEGIGAILGIWLAAGLVSLASTFSAADPFIPAQATVIVLAGVPGDSESERTYQEQVQQWVELATTRQASKVVVLIDGPETSNLKQTSTVEVLKGDRDQFLGLSNALAGTTNPLVVITLGHGGKQGATPVLHVRGPRLTPRDFADLAQQCPASFSSWVLWFRGSGAFASQLAGPRRQVLASDCQTMFSSDPVGMQLLLKIVRGAPAASFAQVAEDLGRATASWYSQRKLARTEEPSLWLEEDKPRLLAGSESEESNMATRGPQPEENSSSQPPDELQKERPEVEGGSSKLSPAWKGISRVPAESFPEFDAVILRQRLSCTLGKRPAIVTEQEQFIQILTPEGKHHGDFDVSYSPPGEEIDFLDCEVLRPDGQMVRLDPDSISEAGEISVGGYDMGRRKIFSLPGVMPGAVLHVRYCSQWNDFPLPHISLELPLIRDLPALQTSVEVSVPKGMPFHFRFEQLAAPDPVVRHTSYSSVYGWQLASLTAPPHEVLSSPRRQARLLLSTFPDWNSFGQWYERITRLSAEMTPEIVARAKDLMKDSPSERQKVLAAYDYVSGLRYVAIPLGINTVRPHAASNVLQNQFGDCKDKANLFNALLQAAHIEAHLVLVPRYSQAYDDIPGLSFNHAISQVKLAGEVLWVDTTDEVCRFGLLPPGDPDRKVLVIDGQAGSLTQLPAAGPNQHRLQIHGELNCGASPEALLTTLDAGATGYPDYKLRINAREDREHRGSVALLSAEFRPVAGSFAVEQQSAIPVSSLDEDFTWRANGTWFGLYASTEGKIQFHSPVWLPKEWDLALNRRHSPLFLNEGYPLTLDEEFKFSLPTNCCHAVLPPNRSSAADPLRWQVEWTRIGDDKLVARFRAQLTRGDLSETETGVAQQQLRALFSALGNDATFVTR